MHVDAPYPGSVGKLGPGEAHGHLDRGVDQALTDLVQLAVDACGVDGALLGLLDPGGQRILTTIGMSGEQAAQHLPLGMFALLQDQLVIEADARAAAALVDLPVVRAEPGVRFFAGVPLRFRDGSRLGVLCVFGGAPRTPSASLSRILHGLARQAEAHVEPRRGVDVARIDDKDDDFVSIVSHELRTPLTSILGALGLAAGGVAGPLSEPLAELVHIAHANSERLLDLVNDLLDVRKLAAGAIHLDLSRVDLREVVARALEVTRPFAVRYGVRVEVGASAGAQVEADFDRLVQVVVNLISNAVKFSPSGATVTVSVVERGGTARLAVSDAGPGIPDDFRPHIFEKFAQASALDGPHRGGTGLGLSIVKSLVDLHRGEVGFESTPGRGTVFHVDLAAIEG
jgi:signal transduction histidine kinase